MSSDLEKKILELTLKVEGGIEKYQSNALFKNCVQALARGEEPIVLINQLIVMLDTEAINFREYMKGDKRPIIIPKAKIYSCRHCGKEFNNEYDLDAHVNFNHK